MMLLVDVDPCWTTVVTVLSAFVNKFLLKKLE